MTFVLTPGKLISMAMRYNHGFVAYTRHVQDEVLQLAKREWDKVAASGFAKPSSPGSDMQMWEEATGNGFWTPERDEYYIDIYKGPEGNQDLDFLMSIVNSSNDQ